MDVSPDVATAEGRAKLRTIIAYGRSSELDTCAQRTQPSPSITTKALCEALDRLDQFERAVSNLLHEGDWIGHCRSCGIDASPEWKALRMLVENAG